MCIKDLVSRAKLMKDDMPEFVEDYFKGPFRDPRMSKLLQVNPHLIKTEEECDGGVVKVNASGGHIQLEANYKDFRCSGKFFLWTTIW